MPDEQPDILELQKQNRELERKLELAKRKTEDLVAATFEGARAAIAALGPLPKVPAPRNVGKSGKEEVALWHLTDWQGSKVTTSYNSEVMRERVLRYCDKAATLTGIQRQHHPVRHCVILFGGDMGEGLFNFPQQVFHVDQTLFGQFRTVGRLEAEVVRRALALYETVEVISEWGNHGRIGSKRDAVPSHDNFDRMSYELARALLEGTKDVLRLKWEDSEEDIRHVEIGNYRALLIHADEVGRTGNAARTTYIRRCNEWRAGAHDWEFQDVYAGHKHMHGEDPLADGHGSLYWTSSPESGNRYAEVGVGAGSRPSQRLHFIDPERGRVTAVYRTWLD